MTVCIVAVCQHEGMPFVIGATDLKVTAGDIQFEPPRPKVWNFGERNHIAVLTAGESSAQAEICQRIWHSKPTTTYEALAYYRRELGRHNRIQAESRVLYPLGLTMQSFLARQNEMSPEFVEQIRHELKQVYAEVETIICGVDRQGPQVFVVDSRGKSYCHTAIGFASIGDGSGHASSQFMFARYVPNWPIARAMLLLYMAKQRAEVAPGVGQATDLFVIPPEPAGRLRRPALHRLTPRCAVNGRWMYHVLQS